MSVQLPEDATSVMIEMFRTRGDPVLFFKSVVGPPHGSLPTVLDFDEFADQRDFRERDDYHHLLLNDTAMGT